MTFPTLAAEPIFHIGSLTITNAFFNSLLATALFVLLAAFLSFGIQRYYPKNLAPKGLLNFMEALLELLLEQLDAVTKDRRKTLKFLPFVGGTFLFILISNWLSQLPGTGSIGFFHGQEFIPLLRPATSDLNLTLALAVLSVALSHVLGVAMIGFFKYAGRFIKVADLFHALKSLSIMKIFVALIEIFVGLLEIVSEIAKMLSLSLRLFGNIFAGEVLLTVMASLFAFLLPLPFMALELIVGIVQAMVFATLVLVYLVMATTDTHSHAETHGVEMEEV